MTARLKSNAGPAALVVAALALVLSVTGAADAARNSVAARLRKGSVVRVDRKGKIPQTAIPKVRSARNADRLGGRPARELRLQCPNAESVDLGTYCMHANPYPVPNEDLGTNDYFYATRRCAEEGGYLPSAAQLIGAAERVKLASTIDDNELNASIDVDATDGTKDRREMSGTLVTTAAGSSAAGSQGVTDGSRGDPKTGEPDPVPRPANPSPETLQYVTVYDNRDRGGFAGSQPVSQPQLFRCAFNKRQGAPADVD